MAPYSPRAGTFVRCVSSQIIRASALRPQASIARIRAVPTPRRRCDARHDQLFHVEVDPGSVVRAAALVSLKRRVHEADHGVATHRHEDFSVHLRDPRLAPALDFTRVRDVAQDRLAGHNFGSNLQVEPGDRPDVSGLSRPDGQPALFHERDAAASARAGRACSLSTTGTWPGLGNLTREAELGPYWVRDWRGNEGKEGLS